MRFYPTGTEPLGWLPPGGMTILAGGPRTGKTTLALQAAAEMAWCGWSTMYIDLSGGFLPEWADHLGVPYKDQNLFALFQINDLERITHTVSPFMGNANLIVLDDIGAASNPRGNRDYLLHAMMTRLKTTNTTMLMVASRPHQVDRMMADRITELEYDRPGTGVRSYKVTKDRHSPLGDMGEFKLPEINP